MSYADPGLRARALCCLAHPASLLAIVVLLLNDHLWKAAYASPLTGKISDVAGLFFFPFLVLVALGSLPRADRHGRLLALSAFAGSALLFAAIKAVAPVHGAFTSAVASLGLPLSVVRDPTDCWALLVMLPAAWLWRVESRVDRSGAPHAPSAPKIMSWIALVGASIATAATSGPRPLDVQRVSFDDGQLFAMERESQLEDWGGIGYVHQSDGSSGMIRDFACCDEGLDMRSQLERDHPVVIDEWLTPAQPQSLICLDGGTCVRSVDGHFAIELSNDGGASWRTEWIRPPRRERFLRRYQRPPLAWTGRYLFTSGAPPYVSDVLDLAVWREGEGVAMAAALGEHGLYLRSSDGLWRPSSLTREADLPMLEQSIDALPFVAPELILLLSLYAGLFWFTRNALAVASSNGTPGCRRWTNARAFQLIAGSALLALVLANYHLVIFAFVGIAVLAADEPFPALFLAVVGVAGGAIAAMALARRRRAKSGDEEHRAVQCAEVRKAAVRLLLPGFSIGLVAILLWPPGIIDRYGLALLLMLTAFAGTTIWSRVTVARARSASSAAGA